MFRSVFSLFSAIALLTCVLCAQESDSSRATNLPAITVSTTRADERTSTVPFSTMRREEIRASHAFSDLPKLLSSMPSMFSISQNGGFVGYTDLRLRGFDQRRIAVLINGIPQNDPEDHGVFWINFPDLASNLQEVQSQRGAGLVNYGAAAIGGSINMITATYADRKFVRFGTGFGLQQYSSPEGTAFQGANSRASLEVSSGLQGNQAIYARLSNISSVGYRDQAWVNLNSFFVSAVRFDSNLTTQINVFGGPISDGLAYTGLPRHYNDDPQLRRRNYSAWGYDSSGRSLGFSVRRRPQEIENFSQPHYEMLNEWNISENLTLKSALFHYTGDGFFDYDGSWASEQVLRVPRTEPVPPEQQVSGAIIKAFVGNRQTGWIPRLVWAHGGGELSVGVEYRQHRSERWGKIASAANLPAGFDPDFKIYEVEGLRDIASVFAREQWNVTESILLNAEAQLVFHRYALRNERAAGQRVTHRTTSGLVGDTDDPIFNVTYLFFNPRLGGRLVLDDKSNLVFNTALTSREPRMRNLYAAEDAFFGARPLFNAQIGPTGVPIYDFSAPLVKPERMLDLELGYNRSSEKYRIMINSYWMEFFNELVRSGRVDVFGVPVDGNAPRTRHYGLELDAQYLFEFSGLVSTLRAQGTISANPIVDYTYQTAIGEQVSLAGNSVAGFPDRMGLASVDVRHPGTGFGAGLQVRHVGGFFTDNFGPLITNDLRIIRDLSTGLTGYYSDNTVQSYTVADLEMSWQGKPLPGLGLTRLRVQVPNCFNVLYNAGGEGKDFFPAAERQINIAFDIEM